MYCELRIDIDFPSREHFATSVQLLYQNRGSNLNVRGKWGGKTYLFFEQTDKDNKNGRCKSRAPPLSHRSYDALKSGVPNGVIEAPLLINRSPSGMTRTSPSSQIPLVDLTRSASTSFHPEGKEASLWNDAKRFSFRTTALRSQSEHLLEASEQSEDLRLWRTNE